MSDNIDQLLETIENTLGESEFARLHEYYDDIETVSSLRVDIPAEIEFVECLALDPIVLLTTIAKCLFHYESPFLEWEEMIEQGGVQARLFVAKLAIRSFRAKVRVRLGLPQTSKSEQQRWMVRSPRPGLPVQPFSRDLPIPSRATQIHHSESDMQRIAKLVDENFPEDVAYIRAAAAEGEERRKRWGVGWLRSADERIDNAERHLFPREGPGYFWVESFTIREILTDMEGAGL